MRVQDGESTVPSDMEPCVRVDLQLVHVCNRISVEIGYDASERGPAELAELLDGGLWPGEEVEVALEYPRLLLKGGMRVGIARSLRFAFEDQFAKEWIEDAGVREMVLGERDGEDW